LPNPVMSTLTPVSFPKKNRSSSPPPLERVKDNSLFGVRAVQELDRIAEVRSRPHMVVSDNRTEFTSNAILKWQQDCRGA